MPERVSVARNERDWKLDRYRTNLRPNRGRLFGTEEQGLVVIVENNDQISVSEMKNGERRVVDTVRISEMGQEPYSLLFSEEDKRFITFTVRKLVSGGRLDFVFPKGLENKPFQKED